MESIPFQKDEGPSLSGREGSCSAPAADPGDRASPNWIRLLPKLSHHVKHTLGAGISWGISLCRL